MRVLSPFFFNFIFNGALTVLSFELGCGSTKNDCIEAWSMRGVASAIGDSYDGLTLIIARDIFWNVVDRIAKVELHLCACHSDNPGDESSFDGDNGELYNIRFPTLK